MVEIFKGSSLRLLQISNALITSAIQHHTPKVLTNANGPEKEIYYVKIEEEQTKQFETWFCYLPVMQLCVSVYSFVKWG